MALLQCRRHGDEENEDEQHQTDDGDLTDDGNLTNDGDQTDDGDQTQLQALEQDLENKRAALDSVYEKHAYQLSGCLNTVIVSKLAEVHTEVSQAVTQLCFRDVQNVGTLFNHHNWHKPTTAHNGPQHDFYRTVQILGSSTRSPPIQPPNPRYTTCSWMAAKSSLPHRATAPKRSSSWGA
jgi:hypothetical protein